MGDCYSRCPITRDPFTDLLALLSVLVVPIFVELFVYYLHLLSFCARK